MFGKAGLGNMMQQVQQMQEKMQQVQEEIKLTEIAGESGAGMVKIVMTGEHKIKSLDIEPDLINKDEKEMLEDLIAAAVNDGMRRVEEMKKEKMAAVTGGMNLPAGFQMPF